VPHQAFSGVFVTSSAAHAHHVDRPASRLLAVGLNPLAVGHAVRQPADSVLFARRGRPSAAGSIRWCA